MGFHPAKFGLPSWAFPFSSYVKARTDRRTDGQTDRHRGPFYNASFPTGRRHNQTGRFTFRFLRVLSYIIVCTKYLLCSSTLFLLHHWHGGATKRHLGSDFRIRVHLACSLACNEAVSHFLRQQCFSCD